MCFRYKGVESKDPAEVAYHPDCHPLQDQIVRILKNSSESISAVDILKKVPDELRRNRKERTLRNQASKILSYLSKQGYLTRVERFKGN